MGVKKIKAKLLATKELIHEAKELFEFGSGLLEQARGKIAELAPPTQGTQDYSPIAPRAPEAPPAQEPRKYPHR